MAGNWKAAHYRVKESYQPLAIVPEKGKSDWQFHLANDHLTDQKGRLKIFTLSFDGDTLFEDQMKWQIAANSTQPLTSLSQATL